MIIVVILKRVAKVGRFFLSETFSFTKEATTNINVICKQSIIIIEGLIVTTL